MMERESAAAPLPRWIAPALVAVIVACFLGRNLPWHLDNFDQAKQAYVSFEMVNAGEWLFQHTPTGHVATKPPLAGWISAALFFLTGGVSWELAWRLPPLICALILLRILWRAGSRLGATAALVAASAFALNLSAPRLATLVRTDMLLTLFIFLAGYAIYEKLRRRETWNGHDRWRLFWVVLGAMLTKGPMVYAFLVPGLIAFRFLTRRKPNGNSSLKSETKISPGTPAPWASAWSGWWPWLLPLAIFSVWAGAGIWRSDAFYREVVLKEFLGRFQAGEAAAHKPQAVYFYVIHILHKWLPWSALLIALFAQCSVRQNLRRSPNLLWLGCWAAGALLFMSAIPSKRLDRIFPIIPPLSLLLAGLVAGKKSEGEAPAPPQLFGARKGSHPAEKNHGVAGASPSSLRFFAWGETRIAAVFIPLAVAIGGGYAFFDAAKNLRTDQRALVHFGEKVRALTAAHPDRLAVVEGHDEGMLLYTRQLAFTDLEKAIRQWRRGELDWLLLSEHDLEKHPGHLTPFRRLTSVRKIEAKGGDYILIERIDPSGVAGDNSR